MTFFTSGELEALIRLRMGWGRLYWNEIMRLQNEDESTHDADGGADLAHEPANRNEESVISVLHEMPTDGAAAGGAMSRPKHLHYDRSTSAHSQLTANALRLSK